MQTDFLAQKGSGNAHNFEFLAPLIDVDGPNRPTRCPLLWRCAGCRRPNHGRCRPSSIFRSGDLETASSASGEGFRSAGAGQRTEGKIFKDYTKPIFEKCPQFQILLKQDWGRQKTTWVPVVFHSTVPRRNFRSVLLLVPSLSSSRTPRGGLRWMGPRTCRPWIPGSRALLLLFGLLSCFGG